MLQLTRILSKAKREGILSEDHALRILTAHPHELPEVMAAATHVRRKRFGDAVRLCSILNAKSGACPEDCAFCAQSVHNHGAADVYDLKAGAEIAEAGRKAARLPIDHFGIVTSGPALDDVGVRLICETIRHNRMPGVSWCASLGGLGETGLRSLREAGLKRLHHNLETAESFFHNICSTHTYHERLATLRAAREAGLEVCSGGILGMGESAEQRVELAMALAREHVDSIPLNFLVAIPGTRLEGARPMDPLDILKCIAMFRLTNPEAEIKVCAGRSHLRSLQSMVLYAGATGIMIGPLLTTPGGDVERDLQMLRDLGMLPAERR